MCSGTTSSCVQYFFHTLVNELTTLFLFRARVVRSKCRALEAKLAASRTGPARVLWMLTPNDPSLQHCPESPFSLSKWYVRVHFPTSGHTRVKSPPAVSATSSKCYAMRPQALLSSMTRHSIISGTGRMSSSELGALLGCRSGIVLRDAWPLHNNRTGAAAAGGGASVQC